MGNITLNQIGEIIIKLAAIVGAMKVLSMMVIAGIKKVLLPIRIKMLKSDLTMLMCLAENGLLSEEQKKLLYEDYDEYIGYKLNSWIHDKFEFLKKEGKI